MPSPLSLPLEDWLKQGGPSPAPLDAVVIGSGYGGSVAALRLAEQGRHVTLLERGSEFLPGEFPNDIGQLPKYLRAQGPKGPMGSPCGLFELRAGPGLVSLVANGMGGGSLINAGVMMRPDDDVFVQPAWPAEIRHALGARKVDAQGPPSLGLSVAFDRAQTMLGGEVFHDPDQAPGLLSMLPKAQALGRLGQWLDTDKAGHKYGPKAEPAMLTIDLDKCTRCGDCFSGCNVPNAKKTLATTYLAKAHNAGVQIVTRCLVYSIAPDLPDAHGWSLRVLPTERGNDARRLADAVKLKGTTLTAKLVVVAAGTFGSTELLLRSRQIAGGCFELSPSLGTRLSGNGDSLTVLADEPTAVEAIGHGADTLSSPAAVGPTITTLIDLRRYAKVGQPSKAKSGQEPIVPDAPPLVDRLVIQEGAVPGALVRVYQELLAVTWVLRHLGDCWRTPRPNNSATDPLAASRALARHTQMLLTMGHDGSKGRIVWVPEMDGAAPYWTHPQDEPTHRRQQRVFAAAQGGGGVHMHTPLWRALPSAAGFTTGPKADPTLLSVHPLGGCPMSDNYEDGVVNHLGQVWRRPQVVWSDLYVLDASIIPTSLGCNPLWTITALAERAMAHRAASVPAPELPCVPRPLTMPPREPLALARAGVPPFDVRVSERLEIKALRLRGALRSALGVPTVESDLRVYLRTHEWLALWDDARHRVSDVSGVLRLVVSDAPTRRLAYRIAAGHVDLLSCSSSKFDGLTRAGRFLLAMATYWVLRGRRDLRNADIDITIKLILMLIVQRLLPLLRLMWQATEVRTMRYDLRLELRGATLRPEAPRELRLRAEKTVRYAATLGEFMTYAWRRLRGCDVRPADLRRSYLDQLTQPVVTLDAAGTLLARLPPWFPGHTRARYDFDLQHTLQYSPLRLFGGGDTSAAMLMIAAYPALVVRHALLTRLFDFRLPDYSGVPVVDQASDEDVALRKGVNGTNFRVMPEEFPLHVRRGCSSSDDGTEQTDKLALRLWRYRRIDPGDGQMVPPCQLEGAWCGKPVRRVKSVLLMHAFGMSGYTFTLKSTRQNFAEYLYSEGWEVWILDSRMSPRTKASMVEGTLDQVALIDVPESVEHILRVLTEELGEANAPTQIFAFGQCLGAAALQMALATNMLSHPDKAVPGFESAMGELPLMPKLAALVSSQTHLFTIGSRSSQSKTWIPSLLRDVAARAMVSLAVRGPVESVVEAFADRLFAALPVPDGERCPAEGELRRRYDDDCATCRRIRFLDAELFKHRNLSVDTHRELPKLFGDANVRLFAHGAKFVEYERLVSEDGVNVYATDEAIGRYFALPIRFFHGAENQLFDKESAVRSSKQYARIHPGWGHAFGRPTSDGWAVCDVVHGYGHLDPLVGANSMCPTPPLVNSPYERMSALLAEAWVTRDARPVSLPGDPLELIVRFPKAGPWFGPIVNDDGKREVRIAFVVDDGVAEATRTRSRSRSGGIQASAIVSDGTSARLETLEVLQFPVPLPARDRFRVARNPALQAIGLRVAWGVIEVPTNGNALRIECISHTLASAKPADLTLDVPTTLDELRAAIQTACKTARDERQLGDRPFPHSLSARRLRAPTGSQRHATLPRHVIAEPGSDDEVRFAVGCCRYAGFPFDRERADEAFVRLLVRTRGGPRFRPALLFMLGDQIYADYSAGLFDPLSPIERFFYRHQQAFTTPALCRLLSRLPVVSVIDDHEFTDAYPLGKPLFRGDARQKKYTAEREYWAHVCAKQALCGYQLMQLPASARDCGWFTLERGQVRFFVADTRRWRKLDPVTGRVTILPPGLAQAFTNWLQHPMGRDALHCVVSGSVFAPGLVPAGNPADPGPADTMQACESERRWLLQTLVREVPGRFVLISGDYHVTFAGEVRLGGKTVGATIVAPPFYAPLPYASATPSELWLDESIPMAGRQALTFHPVDRDLPARGSGYGMLSCQRRKGGWNVALETELLDMECGQGWTARRWPVVKL